MADAAIFDLTAETAMTAAHEFVTQDTSAATRAQSATFALMGGLEIDNTYDSAADHADISPAVVGKHYIVDLSGLTSVMNLVLPTSANVGERIGVSIVGTQNTTPGEELTITAGTSDFLNGVAGGTEWSRLFILGETVIMKCVVANSEWVVETDGRIPSGAKFNRSANVTSHFSNNAITLVTYDEETYDVGSIGDLANDKMEIRRAGRYLILFSTATSANTDSAPYLQYIRDHQGTPQVLFWPFQWETGGNSAAPFMGFGGIWEFATTDIGASSGEFSCYLRHQGGGPEDLLGDAAASGGHITFLQCQEQL